MQAAMTAQDAVGDLLGRVRDWWRRQEELCAFDDKEIGRVAADPQVRGWNARLVPNW